MERDLEKLVKDLEHQMADLTLRLKTLEPVGLNVLFEDDRVRTADPVDNPNKVPMITEFNDYLRVALAGYLKPEGDNTPAEEDETSFKSKFGIKILDIAGYHGAAAINKLPGEFEGGKVKYFES